MQYIVLAVLVVGFIAFVASRYRGFSAASRSAHYGFASDEAVRYLWIGELDPTMSSSERLLREIATGVATHWFDGAADLRPRGVSVALSEQGRLSIVLSMSNGTARKLVYSPDEVRFRLKARGVRRIQGGPSVQLSVHTRDLAGLPILLHENVLEYLTEFID